MHTITYIAILLLSYYIGGPITQMQLIFISTVALLYQLERNNLTIRDKKEDNNEKNNRTIS